MERKMKSTTDNIDIVRNLADALNSNDLARAKSYVTHDLRFEGVFGPPLDGADAYLTAMEKLGAKQIILKVFADETEACCFYQLLMPSRPDLAIFGSAWFKISEGGISAIRVVFDPTPLFAKPSST
jgi:SnoaL-like domain